MRFVLILRLRAYTAPLLSWVQFRSPWLLSGGIAARFGPSADFRGLFPAYNLGNLWRRLVLPKRIDNWSLTSLQQRLVKTGGRLIKHARYYWLLLAESHLTRRLFGSMVRRIASLPLPAG
jgi:hypothetical protein